jgi:predicted RNA-binding protein associated with RNAse of E/G family
MSTARVIERKRRLDGSHVEFECERVLVEPGKRAVIRYVTSTERRLEGTDLTLLPGTVTLGHFWTDRDYTIYAFARDGLLVAHYCSIATEVRIADDLIEYLDLVVDVLIDAKGNALVLDEDELPDDLDPRHRRTINKALEELTGNTRRLIGEIERGSLPPP